VVPVAPTTARDFTPDDTLVMYVELYEDDTRRRGAPHNLRVDAELRRVDGAVVRTISDTVASSVPAHQSGGRPFTLGMPLTGTSPGTYVLSIEGRSGATADQVVTRSIPIPVR
jgi:hypothetical protein